jgi:hypothetical protein
MSVAWIGTMAVALALVGSLGLLWILQRTERRAPAPSRSPVPWLADPVWRRLNPAGYAARRAALVGPALGTAVVRPSVIPVTDDDRDRAPVLPEPRGAVPPAGTVDEQLRRLRDTPGSGRIHSPVWPYCCERLATLIACQDGGERLAEIEASAGPLDRAFLDGELDGWGGPGADRAALERQGWSAVLAGMRDGTHTGQGIAIYCCRACGRVYVASCAPG